MVNKLREGCRGQSNHCCSDWEEGEEGGRGQGGIRGKRGDRGEGTGEVLMLLIMSLKLNKKRKK